MPDGPGGYGRYDDDAGLISCPRAPARTTLCVARDGRLAALGLDRRCAGCLAEPADLLADLVRQIVGL